MKSLIINTNKNAKIMSLLRALTLKKLMIYNYMAHLVSIFAQKNLERYYLRISLIFRLKQ